MAIVALLTILLILAAIMSKKMSPLLALVIIPITSAMIMGGGWKISGHIVKGIQGIAPTVTMFVFAIIFFGVMNDAGMFDPIVNAILIVVGTNPVLITLGTAILAMIAHLDGSGASTFLIAVPAMLPLYEKLGMQKKVLAAIVGLSAGTMNIVPWGGPTIRAISALQTDVTTFFNPLMPVVGVGLLTVLTVAFLLGQREAKRIGYVKGVKGENQFIREFTDAELALKRPKMFIFNILLTGLAVFSLVKLGKKVNPGVVMMIAACLGLMINYPRVADQKARVDAHSKAAIMMGSILLAAGAFTGIMKGMEFNKAMTDVIVAHIPHGIATHIPFIIGIVSMPLSLLFDPDSFYFGIMPVLADATQAMGVSKVAVGQAAVLGQMTTGFPVSPLTPATFLLVGLCGIELSDHQKFMIPLAFGVTVIMTIFAAIIGVFPF